jgi:hypothetical protein
MARHVDPSIVIQVLTALAMVPDPNAGINFVIQEARVREAAASMGAGWRNPV